MTTLLTCVKSPNIHNFSSPGKLLNIIITNNWFMTNNVNYRIKAHYLLTLSIITLFLVDCPIRNLKGVHAGCMQSAECFNGICWPCSPIENLHRNGFFTSEKVMFSNATKKAGQFCFKAFELPILGSNFYRAWSVS